MLKTIKDVKDFIRQPYTWPGGYPKVLVMQDCECICPKCARENYKQISASTRHNMRDDWHALGVQIHWEGAPIECAHCGALTESAYGDPESEGAED